MSIKDFQIIQKLGKVLQLTELGDGSYSCVYKVKRIEDG